MKGTQRNNPLIIDGLDIEKLSDVQKLIERNYQTLAGPEVREKIISIITQSLSNKEPLAYEQIQNLVKTIDMKLSETDLRNETVKETIRIGIGTLKQGILTCLSQSTPKEENQSQVVQPQTTAQPKADEENQGQVVQPQTTAQPKADEENQSQVVQPQTTAQPKADEENQSQVVQPQPTAQPKADEENQSQVVQPQTKNTPVSSVANDTLPPFMTDSNLIAYNEKISGLIIKLQDITNKKDLLYNIKPIPRNYIEITNELDTLRDSLKKEYNELIETKVKYVKETYPSDPVYAMAIPLTIPKDTHYYSAGSTQKISSVCEHGILLDEEHSATAFGPQAKDKGPGSFTDNEMGDRGLYASLDQPAYLSREMPKAIHFKTISEISGISIEPTSELKNRYKFTEEEIDRAFDRFSKLYPFLQHGGLPPSGTEVVFMKTDQKLELVDCLVLNRSGDGSTIPFALPKEIHTSWVRK